MTDAPPASADWAFFLDFDGTLVDIAATPDKVLVTPALTATLRRLEQAADGAVALVSGRAIADLDRLLAPLRLAAAGQHGAERRAADGHVISLPPCRALPDVVREIEAFVGGHPGTAIEHKGRAVALHYRGATAAGPAVLALMRRLEGDCDGELRLIEGKMVAELKPAGTSKGTAIESFLAEPPFRGRTPVLLGDDVTDEDGFAVVNAVGGVSIRIGGDLAGSRARWRLGSPAAVLAWLGGALAAPEPV